MKKTFFVVIIACFLCFSFPAIAKADFIDFGLMGNKVLGVDTSKPTPEYSDYLGQISFNYYLRETQYPFNYTYYLASTPYCEESGVYSPAPYTYSNLTYLGWFYYQGRTRYRLQASSNTQKALLTYVCFNAYNEL